MVALIVEGTCKHAFSFSHCLLTIVRSHISTPYCTMHCFLCAPHGMRMSYDVRSLLADAAWRCGSFQTGPRVRARLRSPLCSSCAVWVNTNQQPRNDIAGTRIFQLRRRSGWQQQRSSSGRCSCESRLRFCCQALEDKGDAGLVLVVSKRYSTMSCVSLPGTG